MACTVLLPPRREPLYAPSSARKRPTTTARRGVEDGAKAGQHVEHPRSRLGQAIGRVVYRADAADGDAREPVGIVPAPLPSCRERSGELGLDARAVGVQLVEDTLGEGIVVHADVQRHPDGAFLEWSVAAGAVTAASARLDSGALLILRLLRRDDAPPYGPFVAFGGLASLLVSPAVSHAHPQRDRSPVYSITDRALPQL